MPVLEVIGSTAAIAQLLGQAITIVQKVQDAREKVHGAADRLDGYKDQLDSLLSTLQLVQDEPELHTAPIEQQVQVIIGLSEELQRYVDDLAARLAKSKARQYTHALTSGERDEKALDGICTRLDQAKTDLNVRILTTNVGLSGSLRSGFTAALAIVQRVDRNVQRVLGERLPIATQLEGRNLGTGNGTVPLTEEDVQTLILVNKVSWVGNEAFDEADLFQADLVERQNNTPKERLYKNNKAHGKSMAFQGEADAEGIAAMIRARRGQ